MWLWHVKMTTQNLLKLLLLLMLMMRNVSVHIWKVKFGHKVNFFFRLWGQGFKIWLKFWSWDSLQILMLGFCRYFDADVWLRFCNWSLADILNLNFDQHLCRNLWLWYDLKKLLWWQHPTLASGPLCLWHIMNGKEILFRDKITKIIS